MYYCNKCKSILNELKEEETTYEEFYGVGYLFPDSHSMVYYVCPCCGAEVDDIEEMEKCDVCKDYFRKNELKEMYVNEEYVGNICKDCVENFS